jgi:MFS family permease
LNKEAAMTQILAFLIFILALAIGEVVSTATKARIPSLLVAMVIMMVGFWVGLPKDLVAKTGLPALVAISTPMMVAHMGTLMSLKKVAQQWKALVIGAAALVGIGVLLLTVYSSIYGLPIAVAAACPISGGIVASQIAMEAMKTVGKPELSVLVLLFLVLQGLIGMPLAANLLKRDVKKNWEKVMSTKGSASAAQAVPEKKLIPALPKAYSNPFVLLVKLAIVAWLASLVAGLTKGVINVSVVAIVFGLIAYFLGFLEEDILTKTGAFTFFMLLLLASVMGSMNLATPQLIVSFIGPILVGFLFGVLGIVVMSWLAGKLLHVSPGMAIAIGSTALFGFPGNYIICQEIAKSMSHNEEEKKAILDYLLPPMIVGGYATVTIGSVVFAGICVRFI